MQAMLQSYELMGYDLILLNPEEDAWLRQSGVDIPANAMVVTDVVQSKTFQKNDRSIVIAVLPKYYDPQDQKQYEAITGAIEELAAAGDLLVAISPWTYKQERLFLEQKPQFIDVLLGAGDGMELEGVREVDDATLWIRNFHKGMRLSIIDVNHWPGDTAFIIAPEDVPVSGRMTPLDGSVDSKQKIQSLFQ